MKLTLAPVLVQVAMLALPGLAAPREYRRVTAVRLWASQPGVARVVVAVDGPFEYRADRAHSPERIFFDIDGARPWIAGRRLYDHAEDNPLVRRVRVAEFAPGVTRVVLDLSGPFEYTVEPLYNPDRLVIQVRETTGSDAVARDRNRTGARASEPPGAPTPPVTPETSTPEAPAAAQTAVAATSKTPAPSRKTKIAAPERPATAHIPAATASEAPPASRKPTLITPERTTTGQPPVMATAEPPAALRKPAIGAAEPTTTAHIPDAASETPAPSRKSSIAGLEPGAPAHTAPAAASDAVGKAAGRTSSGATSLTRVLGLKINRVVIDPGHGGHDTGTVGPDGYMEKDLVLDVAERLGKLIAERMGSEVIYTRTDDTFIPLEGRTALANDKKADLFISVHANSSTMTRITGVETYYLNFTTAKDALDVAARENASSDKSVFELRDLIQQISLQEKVEESRELASRIQTSLFAYERRYNARLRDRGVKKAPFVVLIGAKMPSVLAEIGFLSNTREEARLRRAETRQKLAEALYRGIARYADGLSHFQNALARK